MNALKHIRKTGRMINIQKKDQVHDKDEPDPPDYFIFKA